MTSQQGDGAFRPSWIDLFNKWVEQLRVRPWIFYVSLGMSLVLLQLLVLWLESGSYANELLPIILFNALAVPYLLALIRLLDNQALHALQGMRPILRMSEQEFDAYKIRIANMPFLAPLLAGLAMTLFAILLPLVAVEPQRYAALEQLSVFTIIFHIIDKSSAFLFGVVIYHTIRQLRFVYAISSNHMHINIFQLRPVQAFSGLTAATALGLVIFFYGWLLINPELLADPAILSVSLLFTVLAVLIFVWPLWGVHRLMAAEKGQALSEIEQQFEQIFSRFNKHIAENNDDAAQKLNGTIMSLEIQYNKINAVPTWPWRPETVRGVLTAVALPVLLMFVQYFVQQVLNR
ncbi:MAG: hypothetical protein R3293_28255 [Candidatus Promineifilaceae bacterium]|nr:hypothetical protein [Candidatus Promineifilaceae bacterium]